MARGLLDLATAKEVSGTRYERKTKLLPFSIEDDSE